MSKSASQKLTGAVEPKKPSVKFSPDEDEKRPITNGFYLNRDFAKKFLKVSDKELDNADGIEITVKLLSGKSKKDEDDESEDDD